MGEKVYGLPILLFGPQPGPLPSTHPEETLTEQAKCLTLVSRAFHKNQLGLFYGEICEMTQSHSVLPMNSGAEAVRKWGYRVKGVPDGQAEIIVCDNNFHGRTLTIVGFCTEPQYRDGYAPFTPGFKTIPFGNQEDLEEALTPNTVAFLVEPIQGEGGAWSSPLRDI